VHILISSHFPLQGTGYGTQTLWMVKMFTTLGHSVSVVCWNLKSTEPGSLSLGAIQRRMPREFPVQRLYHTDRRLIELLDGLRYYPCPYPGFPRPLDSNEPLDRILRAEQPELVVFHQDIFPFHRLPQKFAARTVACLPIHYRPMEWNTREALAVFDRFIALSAFGAAQIRAAAPGAPCSTIPLCVDEAIFQPQPDEYLRRLLREQYGLPAGRFIALIIGNNSEGNNRKAFDVQIQAFARLRAQNPDAFLYLHTDMAGAMDLHALIRSADIPNDAYGFVDQAQYRRMQFLPHDVAALFQSVDVLLFASKSEGFGIPLVEAQACGCPVITTNFSSMPELTVNGVCTDYLRREYREDGDSYWVVPSVDQVAEALLGIYAWDEAQRAHHRQRGLEAMRAYTTEAVAARWATYFAEL